MNIRRLQFIGNLWRGPMTMRTEYLDLILDRSHKADTARALLSRMRSEEGCDELVMTDLDLGSAIYGALESLPLTAGVRTHARYCSYEIDCGAGFGAYLAGLSQNARRKLHGQRAKLARLGPLGIKYFDVSEFSIFAELLNRLHCLRWSRPFFTGLMAEFHESLLALLTPQGCARLSIMFVGEQPLSAMYSLVVDGREYHLQGGFDAAFARSLSPGSLHLGYSIERACAEGTRIIDLLVGGGRSTDFKRRFATPVQRSSLVQVVRSRRLRAAYGLLDLTRRVNHDSAIEL